MKQNQNLQSMKKMFTSLTEMHAEILSEVNATKYRIQHPASWEEMGVVHLRPGNAGKAPMQYHKKKMHKLRTRKMHVPYVQKGS